MLGTKLTMIILAITEASAEATDSNTREPQTQRPAWGRIWTCTTHNNKQQVEAVIFSTATTIAV